MKFQGLLIATFSLIGMSGVFAQEVEHDDMYFNSKDRAILNSQRATAQLAYNTPKKAKQLDIAKEERENPTDSYSARSVNPEYIARENSESAQTDEENYFVDNYQYNRTELNNWNNNFNSWYNNSWYRSNYYGPGINTWNSPYYGYNSWNSPWNDPYWSYNGWSSSFSYHYGSRWNYGWGGQYNYWNRPYYGYNSYAWDPMMNGMGYYGGGYWNNYRYPSTVVVVGDGGRDVVYGKRPTRGTSIVTDRNNVRSRTSATNAVRNDDPNSSGRVSTQSRKQDEYYNRYNRQRTTTYPSDSRTNTQNNRSRSWDNSSWDSNNSYNNNRSSSSPSYSPSSSPSNSSGGARTNNSGSSSGGRRGRD